MGDVRSTVYNLMDHFSPLPALAGGLLIGAAAALYLLLTGRYAGLSGILRGATFGGEDRALDSLFIVGLIGGGAIWFATTHVHVAASPVRIGMVATGGLFVGFGTALGRGCTSGHGVCGLGRLSVRSLAAVATFIATGIATVFIVHRLTGSA